MFNRGLVATGSAVLAFFPLVSLEQCPDTGDEDKNPPLAPNMPVTDAGATLVGGEEFIELGTEVASAGDLNGDGMMDLFVSGLATEYGGHGYVVFGPVFGEITFDQGSDPGYDVKLQGERGFNSAGWSLAGGCDFNGDGSDDLLMGAPMADVEEIAPNKLYSGDNAGKAYLQYGSAGLAGKTVDLGSASVIFEGEDPGDTAGNAVACLGDLDADGYDEIAVSAERSCRTGHQAGAVYVFYGRPGFSGVHPLEHADAIFVGESAYDFAGHSVAAGGDVNGDGLPDTLVGAYNNGDGGASAGKVYVLAGSRTRWSGVISLAQATAAFTGSAGERIGWSIAGPGNVDGAGPDDILIGSFAVESGMNNVGGAWLAFGSSGLSGVRPVASGAVKFVGETIGDGAGQVVSGAGDVNADGYADLLFGALNGAGIMEHAGRAYLVRGGPDLPATVGLGGADASFLGEKGSDLAGDRVSGLGDLDGDGFDDLVIAARGHDTGSGEDLEDKSGAAYVFYGP